MWDLAVSLPAGVPCAGNTRRLWASTSPGARPVPLPHPRRAEAGLKIVLHFMGPLPAAATRCGGSHYCSFGGSQPRAPAASRAKIWRMLQAGGRCQAAGCVVARLQLGGAGGQPRALQHLNPRRPNSGGRRPLLPPNAVQLARHVCGLGGCALARRGVLGAERASTPRKGPAGRGSRALYNCGLGPCLQPRPSAVRWLERCHKVVRLDSTTSATLKQKAGHRGDPKMGLYYLSTAPHHIHLAPVLS